MMRGQREFWLCCIGGTPIPSIAHFIFHANHNPSLSVACGKPHPSQPPKTTTDPVIHEPIGNRCRYCDGRREPGKC